MKLQMHAVMVEVNDDEEVLVSQPGGPAVRVTIEQVPFLVELLQQAKAKVEEARYRRQSD